MLKRTVSKRIPNHFLLNFDKSKCMWLIHHISTGQLTTCHSLYYLPLTNVSPSLYQIMKMTKNSLLDDRHDKRLKMSGEKTE